MKMFWEILLFEIRYQLKQPVFYIGCALFFLMTFGAVTTDAISIGGGIGSLNRNAPYIIMQILAVMSVLGVFTATAIVANSTYKDIEHNMQSVFFSTPITKGSYLFGRFWGASIASILIFFASCTRLHYWKLDAMAGTRSHRSIYSCTVCVLHGDAGDSQSPHRWRIILLTCRAHSQHALYIRRACRLFRCVCCLANSYSGHSK